MIVTGYRLITLFFSLFFLIHRAYAQEIKWKTVTIQEDRSLSYDVTGNAVQYFEDATKTATIQQVLIGTHHKQFTTNERGIPNLGFTTASVWLRFKVHNRSDNTLSRILEIKNPNLDVVQLYKVTQGRAEMIATTGDYFKFDKRPIDHRYFQFPVSFIPNQYTLYYLRIDNNGEQLHIPLKLWPKSKIIKRDYYEQYLFGIYYGIIIFVFFLNLFMFVIIKERANLYYLLYIIGLALLQMALSGYAFEFLWPNNSYLANHSLPFLASVSVFFLTLFSISFLNTKTLLPKADLFLRITAAIIFVNIIFSLVNEPFLLELSIVIINCVTLILNALIIPIAIRTIRKGFKPAFYFALAFVVLIFGVFGFVLKNFGLLPSNIFTDYGIQMGSALEVILLSFAIVDKFKRFKDEAVGRLVEMNQLKDGINERLEREVNERTSEIHFQKEELAEKNKNITSSIKYASRIQQAILPPTSQVKRLLKEAFVFYLPKDIVSGDFYWIEERNDQVFFSAVDCTGHGVPGAMMSVIGFNALNKAVRMQGLTKPSAILHSLNHSVAESLRKWSEMEISDGMDLALCSLNLTTGQLEYAGAYNSLYLIREAKGLGDSDEDLIYKEYQLVEFKADKKPIGTYMGEEPYKNYSLHLKKGEGLYIFSDGYADQFGGEHGKKFKYASFKKLLIRLFLLTPDEQKVRLSDEFYKWKGELEQIDDICVMGLRL
jgi:serine phosphatase RsbU (regulator of sigma subunit)